MAHAVRTPPAPNSAQRDRLLLVGVGVGAAPVLALLRELPEETDVVVVLRGATPDEIVLRDEIAGAVARCGGRLVELSGARHWDRLDAAALRGTVPDMRRRETYLCGPATLSRRLADELGRAGVALRRIHVWSFA
jgi:ferredoxin-NADP reductase